MPVVALPSGAAAALARARARRSGRGLARRAPAGGERRGRSGRDFSSRGLAFDGRVKPELVAPGVGVRDRRPGPRRRRAALRRPSTARAPRPRSRAPRRCCPGAALARRGRAAGDPRRLRARRWRRAATAQGAGLVASARAAAAEVAAVPATLPFGRATKAGWRGTRPLVRNVSTRRLPLFVARGTQDEGAVPCFARRARRSRSLSGESVASRVVALTPSARWRRAADGSIVVRRRRRRPIRVPWAVALGPPARPARRATLSTTRSRRPTPTPAVLGFEAGHSGAAAGSSSRWRGSTSSSGAADGRDVGTLATLRDLLPGPLRVRAHRPRPGGKRPRREATAVRVVAYPADVPGPRDAPYGALHIR